MQVTLTLDPSSGSDLGPFNLTANVGSVVPSTATRAELLAGLSVTVDDTATTITATSTGNCTNSRNASISGIPTVECYVYEYINNSSNTIDVNGTLCAGGSYSLPVLPNGEGTTSCIQELSQSTIDAYAALGLILTRGFTPCT
jgi:hypothetical protein